MIDLVHEIGGRDPQARCTIGQVRALPGSINVVPGRIEMTVDLRYPDEAELDAMHDALMRGMQSPGFRAGRSASLALARGPVRSAPCKTGQVECRTPGPRRPRYGAWRGPRRLSSGATDAHGHDLCSLPGWHQPQSARIRVGAACCRWGECTSVCRPGEGHVSRMSHSCFRRARDG
jgi:hypothetical protein